MRIISGKYKGRKLEAPKGQLTRPTQSFMRESVFNILQFAIEGGSFLDLFAGSGAMGLEALSRGAKYSCFIEKSPLALRALQKNIEALSLEAASFSLEKRDALQALKSLKKAFNFVYIDPPYAEKKLLQATVTALQTHELLLPGALVFLESSEVDFDLGKLSLQKKRKFAKSYLLELKAEA